MRRLGSAQETLDQADDCLLSTVPLWEAARLQWRVAVAAGRSGFTLEACGPQLPAATDRELGNLPKAGRRVGLGRPGRAPADRGLPPVVACGSHASVANGPQSAHSWWQEARPRSDRAHAKGPGALALRHCLYWPGGHPGWIAGRLGLERRHVIWVKRSVGEQHVYRID